MFRLTRIEGRGKESAQRDIDQYPFVVGKNQEAHWCLSGAGVWDDHVAIDLDDQGRPFARRSGDGSLSVNAEPVESHRLRDGDTIEIGAVVLRFGQSPVTLKPLTLNNLICWLILVSVLIAEAAAIIAISRW